MPENDWDLSAINDFCQLEEKVKACRRCSLRHGCNQVVFGEGNPAARIVLCGEGPGADEDRLGRPFVGRAGQLLDKILEACGFNRFEHVYILNTVKCRPPGNRVPAEDERMTCRPNLEAQLRLIRPVIIVLMGATALQEIIDPKGKITKVRGTWTKWESFLVMPTYHPAALLRNPKLKVDVWKDFKEVVYKYRELVNPDHYSENC